MVTNDKAAKDAQKATEAKNAQKQTSTNKSGGAAERIPPSPEAEPGVTAADAISGADKDADRRHAAKENLGGE